MGAARLPVVLQVEAVRERAACQRNCGAKAQHQVSNSSATRSIAAVVVRLFTSEDTPQVTAAIQQDYQ